LQHLSWYVVIILKLLELQTLSLVKLDLSDLFGGLAEVLGSLIKG
jgi:hypothetical protein